MSRLVIDCTTGETTELQDDLPSFRDVSQEWAIIRAERNAKLAVDDWTVSSDSPLTDECVRAFLEYRKALRNVPTDNVDPSFIVWPERPREVRVSEGELSMAALTRQERLLAMRKVAADIYALQQQFLAHYDVFEMRDEISVDPDTGDLIHQFTDAELQAAGLTQETLAAGIKAMLATFQSVGKDAAKAIAKFMA